MSVGIIKTVPPVVRAGKRSSTDASNVTDEWQQMRLPLLMPHRWTMLSMRLILARWLMHTPLGLPVEPDV